MKNKLALFIITLIVTGCTKEEVTPRVFPRVNTIQVMDITSGGATFKAEITFSSVPILDHGFIWSKTGGQSFTNADRVSLGAKTGAGTFEAKVDRSLEEGIKYFVRAFAISEDHTVFGDAVEFVSLGSKAPVFKDFFPALGTWDDTVTIVGENFSQVLIENDVKFSGTDATVIKASPDTLQVLVPYNLISDLSTVTISLVGNSVNHTKQFQLKAPIIESVTPTIGLTNTIVTITGKLLNSFSKKIYFGDTEASVLSWSATKIECKVPVRPNGDALLKIVTGSGGLFATYPFKIQPEHLPELYQVQPAVAKIGETIKLIGDHFATDPGMNSVKFGNTPTYIISESKTQIEVAVPETETRTSTITVTSYGSSVSIDGFALKSPVITDFSPHRGIPGGALTITGSDFIWSHLKVFLDDEQLPISIVDESHIDAWVPRYLTKHEFTVKVTFYDQEYILSSTFKSPWIMLDVFPGTGLMNSQVFIYNNAAYLAMAGPQNNQVWKFNGDQWNQLNNFPGSANGETFSFIVGAKGYVGGGTINATAEVKELWEFDFVNDTWTQQSNIPHLYNARTGFTVGSNGFSFDADYINQSTLRMYNATTDTWSIKSVAPMGVPAVASPLVIGTDVYLVDSWGAQTWKYTPSSNQWNNLGSTPDIFNVAFAIGGVGYACNRSSFYKFNTTTNSWTQEPMPTLYDTPAVGFSLNGKGYIVSPSWYNDYEKYVYEFDPNF